MAWRGTGSRGLRLAAGLTALAALAACATPPPPPVKLSVQFVEQGWTGGSIPAGQQCAAEGGQGFLPSLRVGGLTEDTATIQVAVNNVDDPALSTDGGHGVIGYDHSIGGPTALLPAIPGGTTDMPPGVMLIASNRADRDPPVEGYLPPCSGRAGHLYEATVTGLDAGGQPTGFGKIRLGRY